ncbi:hypothetical protein LXL04_010025 [Taraxacum kok-saghyz]
MHQHSLEQHHCIITRSSSNNHSIIKFRFVNLYKTIEHRYVKNMKVCLKTWEIEETRKNEY